VELDYFNAVPTNPVVVKNPHYNGGVPKAAAATDTEIKIDGKVKREVKMKAKTEPGKIKTAGWKVNPFFETRIASN